VFSALCARKSHNQYATPFLQAGGDDDEKEDNVGREGLGGRRGRCVVRHAVRYVVRHAVRYVVRNAVRYVVRHVTALVKMALCLRLLVCDLTLCDLTTHVLILFFTFHFLFFS
jgi:hypothetical protein